MGKAAAKTAEDEVRAPGAPPVPGEPAAAAPPSISPRTRRIMIFVLLASNFLSCFNNSMMNVALDNVSGTYHIALSTANWMIISFAIMAGTAVTVSATLLERWGLRRVMLFGYGVTIAASAIGLLGHGFASLLVAQTLQAITSGLFYPTAGSVILAITPDSKAAPLIGLNSAIIGVAMGIAPLCSGVIITYIGLSEIFLVPLVYAALLAVFGFFFLHDVFPRQHRAFDWPSAAISFVGMGGLIFGLNEIAKETALSVGLIVVGLAAMALFVRRQLRIHPPLLDMDPLRYPSFTVGEAIVMLGHMTSGFLCLLVPLYLEGVAGMTPFAAAGAMLVPILLYVLGCAAAGPVQKRWGIWPLVPVGYGCMFGGFIALVAAAQAHGLAAFLIACAVVFFGNGLTYPSMKMHDLASLPDAYTTHGSSIHSVLGQIFSALSSALFVSVMSWQVSRSMAAGAGKAAAYGAGFQLAGWIDLAILGAVLVAAIAFSIHAHRGWKARQQARGLPSDAGSAAAPQR